MSGFLDILGDWDPGLMVVLGGAVSVSTAGYAPARRLNRPALDPAFHWLGQARIDPPPILGAVLFGIGWGVSGFCTSSAAALTLRAPAPR